MSVKPNHQITTIVRALQPLPGNVLLVELADPDGWELPPFTPGAHIDVRLPNGLIRQYSLMNAPNENSLYRIGVGLETEGRGGSRYVHEELQVGDTVSVSLPRNLFPAAAQGHHVMIAGGIGITPFLSMLPWLEAQGQQYELHYCTRERAATPFLEALAERTQQGAVRHYFTRENGNRPDLSALIGEPAPGRHVYCCGPTSMVDAVIASTEDWPTENVHIERFGAASSQDASYTIMLARTHRKVPVADGQSMLAALRAAGVDVPSSCEAGICKECITAYLDGDVVHRDLVLNTEERKRFLAPCVSGCQGSTITLDL